MTALTVKQSAVVSLLVSLGVDTAAKWPVAKLKKVLTGGGVEQFLPDPLPELSDDQAALLAQLRETDGAELDIEGDGPPARKPRKKKPKKKPQTQAAGEEPKEYPKGFASWPDAKKVAYWKNNPRPIPPDGLARAAYDQLVAAGRGRHPRPISKAGLLLALAHTFKGRDQQKMANNLNNLVPGRMRDVYGQNVQKKKLEDGSYGYYIVRSEG